MKADKPIREIMTTDLVTVSPSTNVSVIKEIFDKHDFHHLPVVDKGEELTGIISKEDFFKLSYLLSLTTSGHTFTEKEYESLKAKDIMTKYPLSLDPEDTTGLAADIFLVNKFHALPIIEDGRLLGLITTHDLLKYSFDSKIVIKEGEETEEEEEVL
jgi:CBS domain-containing protein